VFLWARELVFTDVSYTYLRFHKKCPITKSTV